MMALALALALSLELIEGLVLSKEEGGFGERIDGSKGRYPY